MSLWKRVLAVFGKRDGSTRELVDEAPPQESSPRRRSPPNMPTLAEMRAKLRAGMSRDEFFTVLDEIVIERGLRLSMPTNDDRLIALPVVEGGELLCFLPDGTLNYVEYQGDVFLER